MFLIIDLFLILKKIKKYTPIPLVQIWMDHQNMSEHVLCMVLYLVELGLDNHAQEDKEDEVSGSSAVA